MISFDPPKCSGVVEAGKSRDYSQKVGSSRELYMSENQTHDQGYLKL